MTDEDERTEEKGPEVEENSTQVTSQVLPPAASKKTLGLYIARAIHWKYFVHLMSSIVAGADIYLAIVEGLGTAISALSAEGTLALALATYLRMKSDQGNFLQPRA